MKKAKRYIFFYLLSFISYLFLTACDFLKDDEPPVVTLKGITVTYLPEKTLYLIGEGFDLTGLVVTAVYSDDSGKVTEDYSIAGFCSDTPGSKTIIVYYRDFTAEFTIIVEYAYTLTININETNLGTILRYPDRSSYSPGTEVTLWAKPTGTVTNAFDNWTGVPPEVERNAEITIIMNSDLTLTANFRSRDKKTHKEIFDAGHHTWSLPDNVRFPATIEVYALGAGGGGQGGHRSTYLQGLLGTRNEFTAGGAGGGGAAAFAGFEVSEQVLFTINVGQGGAGGSGTYVGPGPGWISGLRGNNGGNTTVSWPANNANILTVEGGRGGGMNRTDSNNRDLTGGAGGTMSLRPAGIAVNDWRSRPGNSGENGAHNNNGTGDSPGGAAGGLNIGSINPFGGGSGGSLSPPSGASRGGGGAGNHGLDIPVLTPPFQHPTFAVSIQGSGNTGGDGEVRIIVTWLD